jgi:hypothetical protein
MKKFAGMSYDITDYVAEGKVDYLVALTKGDSDELTKTAHIPSRDEIENIPNDQFAVILYHPQLGMMRKFAMTDKYVTKLNMKLFMDNQNRYPDEIAKTAAFHFVKAAKNFNVPVSPELKKLAEGKHETNIVPLDEIDEMAWEKKSQSMVKKASEEHFALPDKKKYPINTEEQVKTAVMYFSEHAHKFKPMDAITYAMHTKLAADKFSIDYSDTELAKYASLTGDSFNPDMRAHLMLRKGFVPEEDRGVYDELMQKRAKFGTIKTAEYLEKVDRKLGIDHLWGTPIEDPYISVLGMRKFASCSYKGKTIKHSMLKKAAQGIVDKDTLTDLTGPDGIVVFESLPDPIKQKIINNI